MSVFFPVVIVCLFCFNIRIDFISRTVRNEVIQLFERAKHHIPRYYIITRHESDAELGADMVTH